MFLNACGGKLTPKGGMPCRWAERRQPRTDAGPSSNISSLFFVSCATHLQLEGPRARARRGRTDCCRSTVVEEFGHRESRVAATAAHI
eukprot:scaffold396_cov127-Isochrysis_galbana.AAC.5